MILAANGQGLLPRGTGQGNTQGNSQAIGAARENSSCYRVTAVTGIPRVMCARGDIIYIPTRALRERSGNTGNTVTTIDFNRDINSLVCYLACYRENGHGNTFRQAVKNWGEIHG